MEAYEQYGIRQGRVSSASPSPDGRPTGPGGFGFLAQIVDSRVLRDAGYTNLGIVDPTIDARIDQALRTADRGAREGMWADIDHKVMEDVFVLPGVTGAAWRTGSAASSCHCRPGQSTWTSGSYGRRSHWSPFSLPLTPRITRASHASEW